MSLQLKQEPAPIKGTPFRVRRDKNEMLWSEFERGVWEPDTRLVFNRFIDAQHSYIDIGAWIGPTVLMGCPLAKCVYAIEPDPIAFPELVENIASNRPLTDNVKLFNICITPESGKKFFGSRGDGGDSMSSLLFSNGKTSWTVDGMNFEEWMEQNNIRDCSFIKIDIEGGEYSVIPTMSCYIKKHHPALYLSFHACFLGREVRGFLAGVRRCVYRLNSTLEVLKALKTYKYVYNPRGKITKSGADTLPSRLHYRLARMSWKPIVLLLACLYGALGKTDSLVFSDQRW